MVAALGTHDWRNWKVRERLLLLLCFAVTRERSDRSAALALADELDSVGLRRSPAAPSFFLRTSEEVCEAILAVDNGHSRAHDAVLRRHVARIEDLRLRRAFQAAVGLQRSSETQQEAAKSRRRKNRDWWKGLPRK